MNDAYVKFTRIYSFDIKRKTDVIVWEEMDRTLFLFDMRTVLDFNDWGNLPIDHARDVLFAESI